MLHTSNDPVDDDRLGELSAACDAEAETFLVVRSLTDLNRLEAELLSTRQQASIYLSIYLSIRREACIVAS